MNKKTFFSMSILMLVVIFLVAKPSSAGWIIKMKTQSEYEVSRSVIYVQKNKIRIVEDAQTAIFNAETNEMCFIDVRGRKYWKGNVQDFKKAMTGFQKEMKAMFSDQMEEHMQNLSEEQKAMMQEAMQQMKNKNLLNPENPPMEVQITRTSEMGNIADYPARKYLVKVNGELKEEVWLAENMIEKKDLDPEVFKSFFDSFRMGMPLDYESTEEYWAFEKKGFPLKTLIFDQNFQQEEIAEDIIEKNIEEKMFLAPDDFQRVDLLEILKGLGEEE